MVQSVQAHPIRIALSFTGPPGWETGSSWMVGESKGPAMGEVLRDVAHLAREAVPRLAAGWSHTDATITDHSVRVHVTVEGPTNHAESVELFGVGRATVVGKRSVVKVILKATRFIREEVARMELAWADTARYWEWMRRQEEARLLKTRRTTLLGAIRWIVETDFQDAWFSPSEVWRVLREVHGSVALDAVSGRLSRLQRAGVLVRAGSGRRLRYRFVGEAASQPSPYVRPTKTRATRSAQKATR